RVGKTQICRRLRGLEYDDHIPSTHGITVTSTPWTTGRSEEELLNIWDFGGQDIYHGTHTLFMKTNAIFMAVWHPDFETETQSDPEGISYRNYPLSYWVEYVRTLGNMNSPLIVVQSRCDRPEQESRHLPIDDKNLQLRPRCYSAKTNRGR